MNFLWTLFGIFSILLQIQEISTSNHDCVIFLKISNILDYTYLESWLFIISGEFETLRKKSSAPLALLLEYNRETAVFENLKLAIPYKHPESKKAAKYFEDTNGENGPIQRFTTACPASASQQDKETEWRNTANLPKKSRLFFFRKLTSWKMECKKNIRPGPSIKKTNMECGNSRGDIYEVGYSVNYKLSQLQCLIIFFCHDFYTSSWRYLIGKPNCNGG